MSKTFDPWKASESAAKRATLRMGFDPMAVALVKHRGSRLAFLLPGLPREAPLRRWCAAGQVLQLHERGEATASMPELHRALMLCLVHDLVPPRWLALALGVRLQASPSAERPAVPALKERRLQRRRRRVWEVMRRFRWAHAGAADEVLWQALAAGPVLGPRLELGVSESLRRLGLRKTAFRKYLNEARGLYEEPTWPARVPPPMTY